MLLWPQLSLLASLSAWQRTVTEAIKGALPVARDISLSQFYITPQQVPPQATVNFLSPHPPLGLVTFGLTWPRRGAGDLGRAEGSTYVRARVPLVVTLASLQPGEALASKIHIRYEDYERAGQNYFDSLDQLKHSGARVFLSAGIVLTAAQVERIPDITRGDIVEVQMDLHQVHIATALKALEDGFMGQRILLENPQTHKQVTARLEEKGLHVE